MIKAKDANNFVSTFQYPITESVPHIYVSAVPFSPTKSGISKQFGLQIPKCAAVTMGMVSEWPVILNVMEGHTDAVRPVAFSPDGQLIVSGSDDQTVWVWATESRVSHGYTAGQVFPHRTRTRRNHYPWRVIPVTTRQWHGIV